MADTAKDNNEGWLKWVALWTTLFAVSAAIGTIKNGGFSTRVNVMTTQEANAWAYFQSKSIKQHVCETQLDLLKLKALGPNNPAEKRFLTERIATYEADVARYDKEKGEIKAEAEKTAADRDAYKAKGGTLSLAIMFLQISIMLVSVASLLKQKPLFQTGGAMGLVGVGILLYGLYF